MSNRITIWKGDITTLNVEAIVNAANSSLMGGGGVDGAIHRAAGPDLKAYCRTLGGCSPGDARVSPGFKLPADFVIHTVGPVWNNGTQGEAFVLASAYRRSMEEALKYGVETIAFPSISTGAYRFPFQEATIIARDTIREFLAENYQLTEVVIVAFSDKDYRQMLKIYGQEEM